MLDTTKAIKEVFKRAGFSANEVSVKIKKHRRTREYKTPQIYFRAYGRTMEEIEQMLLEHKNFITNNDLCSLEMTMYYKDQKFWFVHFDVNYRYTWETGKPEIVPSFKSYNIEDLIQREEELKEYLRTLD